MRVTAVLFCYNQAQFLHDAVRDTLAQEAENLDIILSDDCSSDESFSILVEEAELYRGPHRVKVNRTERNRGLNAHINSLVEMSEGELIVPFAGDDRFRPDRVRKLAARCRSENSWLVHSDCGFIRSDGETTDKVHSNATFFHSYDVRTAALSQALFIGATAGWRRALFEKYGPLPENRAFEDLILGFRAALEGAVSFVPEPLVEYRVGVGISFNALTADDSEFQAKRVANLTNWRDVLLARLSDATMFGLVPDDQMMKDLRLELENVETRLAFHQNYWALARKWLAKPRNSLYTIKSERRSLRQKQL